MSRRRREPLSAIASLLLLGAFVGVVCGAAGYLVQRARGEAAPESAPAAESPGYFAASGSGFDISSVPGGGSGGSAAAAGPAPTSSPLPVYTGAPGAGPAAAPASAPAAGGLGVAARPSAAPAAAPAGPNLAERYSDPRWTALLASPASFIARRTLLGSPAKLETFLADRSRWTKYVNHPLIAGVLASPTLVRALVRPAMVRAFIQSPAMSDPAAVRALSHSPLVKQILAAPGVRQALTDPAFLSAIYNDSETTGWLARNPDGMKLITGMADGLKAQYLPQR